MIFDVFDDLNWLAVVVAAAVWFGFSAVWYSVPPISQAWQRASKATMGEGGSPLPVIFAATFACYVVTTIAIALIAGAIGADSFGDGLALGVVLGIGFGAVAALVTQLYEQKGSSYWLINGANAVISFSLVAVIVSVWD